MKTFAWVIVILLGLGIFGMTCNFFSDGARTVNEQFNPSVMLKKYEYFKDLSAAIDKKRADIEMYREILKTPDEDSPQRKAELIGIISMHNQMCADYNSAMSKFNYAFCNKGTLPASNLEPLPREIKPYIHTLK